MADDTDNDVFAEPNETSGKDSSSQKTVRNILQQIELGEVKQQRYKRSRDSQGSNSESLLLSKFDEVMTLIRKENETHHKSILSEIRKELSTVVKEIECKLDAVKVRLEQKVADLEAHVSERDDLVENLNSQVKAAKEEIKKIKEDAEAREMQWRSSELILSGKAVPPAPRPGAAADHRPEDLRRTACDVIHRAFPRAALDPGELADVRRIGARVLLVRFVRTGQGSLRRYIYDNRMLLKGKSGDNELFINESLTQSKRDIFNKLLVHKKAGRLYCVFSQNGVVYCKTSQTSQKVLVGDVDKADMLFR